MRISTKVSPNWLLIKDLSNEEKLSLIALLTKSLQEKTPSKKVKKKVSSLEAADWVQHFAESWNDFPETAGELIEVIKGRRVP
jgi:hypothetical protein